MRSLVNRIAVVLGVTCITIGIAVPVPALAKEASGEPLAFGMFNLENSPFGSSPEYRLGAEAAIEYVNQELGGIHGRPIELSTCTVESPETSIGCATELLNQNPVAVLTGVDPFSFVSLQAYVDARVPLLGGVANVPPESADNAIRFTGWATSGPTAMAKYAGRELKAKSVAVLYPDLPPAKPLFDDIISPVLKKHGVEEIEPVPANVASSDMTTAMVTANESEPDAIIGVVTPTQCVSALQAKQSLGIDADLMLVGDCTSPKVLEEAGAAADGVYFGYQFLPPSAKDKDVRTFLKKMKKYEPGAEVNEITQAGFASVMNVWELLNSAPEATLDSSEAILGAFKATQDHHNWMSHPYTCDGNQVAESTEICNSYARMVQVKDGKLVDIEKKWLDGFQDIEPVPSS